MKSYEIKKLLVEINERRHIIKNPVVYTNLTQERIEHLKSLDYISTRLKGILKA